MSLSRTLAGILLAVCLIRTANAETLDGPYVMRGTTGWEAWYVESGAAGNSQRVEPVKVGAKVVVPAVGSLPSFDVTLRKPAVPPPDAIALPSTTPLFVVADTHGEFEILAGMLKAHHVIGDRLQWTFGRGHLVFLGDALDRGAHQLEILWLAYELEEEARRAGGGVHFVLGNHEVMEMRGDSRYLNPRYEVAREVLGVDSWSRLLSRDSLLGQWLRTRPALQAVGGNLCLHGGVSRELLDGRLGLAGINRAVREAIDAPASGTQDLLLGPSGPLWYRGYFPDQLDFVPATEDDIDRTLETFGVRTLLIGHTIVPTITPMFGGKVIAVQVYPKRDAAGAIHFETLFRKNGQWLRALPDGGAPPLFPR